jgi:hypothetical protein
MSHHIVELKDVCFAYPDGTEALKGITFRILHGEAVGLVGANGAERPPSSQPRGHHSDKGRDSSGRFRSVKGQGGDKSVRLPGPTTSFYADRV